MPSSCIDVLISLIRLGLVSMPAPITWTGNETITNQSGFTTVGGACGHQVMEASVALPVLRLALCDPVRQNGTVSKHRVKTTMTTASCLDYPFTNEGTKILECPRTHRIDRTGI